MKKIKLDGRLSLNKETIATLNDNQMNAVKGGDKDGNNFLSLGEDCTLTAQGCFSRKNTRGVFCSPHQMPTP